MPDVKLIVGLCGSGKSHHAKELEGKGYVVLDEGFSADDPGAEKHLSTAKFNALVDRLTEGKNCAFTEAMLMFEQRRQEFEPCLKTLQAMKGVTVEWVFFAKDPDSANHNCRNDPNRTDGKGRADKNDIWSHCYTIPAGHTPRPIVRIPERKSE